MPDLGEGETISNSIPADPDVKNFSYTVVDGHVYFRENSIMVRPDLNKTAEERIKGMVAIRDCVHQLMDAQLYDQSDSTITALQTDLNQLYDDFTRKYGLINSRGNSLAFSDDSSYYLLCSLEILDEEEPGTQSRYVHQAYHPTAKPGGACGYRRGSPGRFHW